MVLPLKKRLPARRRITWSEQVMVPTRRRRRRSFPAPCLRPLRAPPRRPVPLCRADLSVYLAPKLQPATKQKRKIFLLCPWRLGAATSGLMTAVASNTSGIKPPLRAGISRAHYARPPASLQDSISAVLTCFAARDTFSGRRCLLLEKPMNYSSGDRARQHFYPSCAVLWM